MPALFVFLIYLGMFFSLSFSAPAQAQNFVLPAGLQASWCSTSWSVSGSTYTCTGDSGKVTFPRDAIVSWAGSITIIANAGFVINNAKLGSKNSPVLLRAPNGGAEITSQPGAEIYGSIETQGVIKLDGAYVSGALSSSNGSITLTGGRVDGLVKTECCTLVAKNTDLLGGAQSNSNMTIEGGRISGEFKIANARGGLVNNSISISNAEMVSGYVNAFNVTISGSQLGSAQSPVEIIARGNDLKLTDNSVVYGHVEVANTYGVIDIQPGSRVIGTCLADSKRNPNVNSNVIGECGGGTVPAVHHYRLDYSPTALTCSSLSVTITACADANCSSTSSTPSSLALSPSAGWSISNPITFTGTTTATLVVRSPGEITLGVDSAAPASSSGLVCSTSGCKVMFHDSGFVMRDLSPLVAGKPRTGTIQAVRKSDSSPGCAPAFSGGPRTLQFSAHYVEPTGPFGTALTLRVGNTDLVPDGPAQNVSLTFDSSATAPFPVSYLDAGVVRLNAAFTGTTSSGPGGQSEVGLQMTGSSELVSRPFGLCLETDLKHDSSKRFARAAGGETVHVAGDAFELRVRAVAWTAADEADPDASAPRQPRICENPTTPNYEQAGISLTHAVLEPDPPANNGNLTIKSYAHQRGERTVLAGQKIDEVGIFQLTAEPPAYWGHSMAHAVTLSDRIGRFIPARLLVTGVGSLKSCDGVSYQGEPLEYQVVPSLTVTALNLADQPAGNYDRGSFWRLENRPSEQWLTQETERDITSKLSLNRRPVENGVDDGDGARVFSSEKDDPDINWDLKYGRSSSPGSEDLKFSLRNYYPKEVLTDQDEVCHRANEDAECDGYILDLDGGDIRLGRLQIGNAHGSELENLTLPWSIQSWQAPGVFLTEAEDSCSAVGWLDPDLDDFTGELEGHTSLVPSEVTGHNGVLELRAPGRGHTGSATVGFPSLPEWFWYDWRGEGQAASRGLATFGIYQGPKPLIFRRELYRGM